MVADPIGEGFFIIGADERGDFSHKIGRRNLSCILQSCGKINTIITGIFNTPFETSDKDGFI